MATDSPEAPSFRLNVSFTVKAMIKVLPRPQIGLRGVAGDVGSARLLLRRSDGEQLEVKEIKVGEPGIVITTEPVDLEADAPAGTKPEAGDLWLVATASEELKVGNHSTTAWITTNHPKMPELEIPVVVRVRPVIEARPSTVQMVVQEKGGGPRGSMFRVNNNMSRPFAITSVKVKDEDLITASVVDQGESLVHSVIVEIPDSLEFKSIGARRTTEIILQTSDPESPEVVVPVTIVGRKPVTRSGPIRGRVKPTMDVRPTPRPRPTGTVVPG